MSYHKSNQRETRNSETPLAPKAKNMYGFPGHLNNLNSSTDENEDLFSSEVYSGRQRKSSKYSEYNRKMQAQSKGGKG